MPKLSIIIPIYNAEKALNRCIDSVLKQNYKDFELILMDDGSKDTSPQICDEYAAQDDRVIVVHKPNSGVSDTRNQAIQLAKGEYLQFIDADDWITNEASGLLVRTMEETGCDMVIADFYRVIGERVSQKGSIEKDGLLTREEFAEEMLKKPADFYYGVLWNKLFKKATILENEIKMDPAISWCEDFIFNMSYIRQCRNIYVLKMPIYYYVKTKGSLVSQSFSVKSSIEMKRMVFKYYDSFYRDIFGEEEYVKRRLQVYQFLVAICGDSEMLPPIFPSNYKLGDERTKVSDEIRNGEGFFFDIYREQKLQERLFDIVAFRNELSVEEVKLLYYLSQSNGYCDYEDTCKMLGIGRTSLTFAIRRLQFNGYIVADVDVDREQSGKTYLLSADAGAILSEILFVLNDFEQMQYEGFTEEEIRLYEQLNARRNQNIRNAL